MPKKHHYRNNSHHKAFIESFLLVGLSFLVAFFLYQLGFFHELINSLHGFGYIGIFIVGMFFVSVFTAAPSAVLLLLFTETHPLWIVALIAGAGAAVGDGVMLTVLSHGINETLAIFPKEVGLKRIIVLLRHTKHRFLLTVVGALVVASPLPDELGLALMGISKVRPFTVAVLTFVLNTVGLYLLLMFLR